MHTRSNEQGALTKVVRKKKRKLDIKPSGIQKKGNSQSNRESFSFRGFHRNGVVSSTYFLRSRIGPQTRKIIPTVSFI